MMKIRSIVFTTLLMLLFNIVSAQVKTGDVTVQFSGLRNYDGQILMNIFVEAEGFPAANKKAYRYEVLQLSPSNTSIVIKDLEYGTYALAILHDENSTDNVEMNGIGIPREGVAFSQNAFDKLRAPTFEECAFTLDKAKMKMYLKFRYFLKLRKND